MFIFGGFFVIFINSYMPLITNTRTYGSEGDPLTLYSRSLNTDFVQYNSAEVIRIVDGDTVDFRIDLGYDIFCETRARLSGINAPEVTGDEKPRGLKATKHLTKLIGGKPVIVRADEKGKFGRWITKIYVDKVDICDKMVEDGHAIKVDY